MATPTQRRPKRGGFYGPRLDYQLKVTLQKCTLERLREISEDRKTSVAGLVRGWILHQLEELHE